MLGSPTLQLQLEEWEGRLERASWNSFLNAYNQFFQKIQTTPSLKAILQQAMDEVPVSESRLLEHMAYFQHGSEYTYESHTEQASILYHLNLFILRDPNENFEDQLVALTSLVSYDLIQAAFIAKYITPLVDYLQDHLEGTSAVLYILEKYKRRTEWFKQKELRAAYAIAAPHFEQVFEDDLRLYLFDQGINFPFSTPSSISGRSDIVGLIDTEDPLVLEIKIYDSDKNYGKDRIKSGFAQIVRYCGDYNKKVGYLVIFNLDPAEIHIDTGHPNKTFPFRLEVGNKIYYILVINLNRKDAASRIKQLATVTITTADLLSDS